MGASRPRSERSNLQRGIIILPSAFTLASLFFGIWSIIAALRGDLAFAGWFIVTAAALDMLDGRIARFTRTGSTFGAELDSIVDGISFGVAPAVIIYHLYLADANWSWVVAYLYVGGTVLRLARFNVEQGGHAKVQFHGLPSPTAGMVLATFYPFSQTPFFVQHLAHLPWPMIMTGFTLFVAALMVSHIPYPVFPKFGIRSGRELLKLGAFGALLTVVLIAPSISVFPLLVAYIIWPLLKAVFLGLLERLPERDPLLDVEDEGSEQVAGEARAIEYENMPTARARQAPEREPSPDANLRLRGDPEPSEGP
ncbi:MAG: CDP-diacylglycerol--serine O-phosphatidyltransferase [Gemmatimonadetes bacterium]|nr:CDP-diacylglycerol--serine O-phosphatidyltransferase [Gemmatimonadota bacterium]